MQQGASSGVQEEEGTHPGLGLGIYACHSRNLLRIYDLTAQARVALLDKDLGQSQVCAQLLSVRPVSRCQSLLYLVRSRQSLSDLVIVIAFLTARPGTSSSCLAGVFGEGIGGGRLATVHGAATIVPARTSLPGLRNAAEGEPCSCREGALSATEYIRCNTVPYTVCKSSRCRDYACLCTIVNHP